MWLDNDARVICANCRQVRIEAGSWPHLFEADAAVKTKRGKQPLCKYCELLEGDLVHTKPIPAGLADGPALVDLNTTPGDTPPAESVEIAREHVVGDGSGEALPEFDPANPERVRQGSELTPASTSQVIAPDPAFDFDEKEPRPSVISTHPIDIGGGK
jgi:hypothetical protein